MNEQMSMPVMTDCETGTCARADEPLCRASGEDMGTGDLGVTAGSRVFQIAACGRNARFGYTVSKNRSHTYRHIHSLQDLCVADVTPSV